MVDMSKLSSEKVALIKALRWFGEATPKELSEYLDIPYAKLYQFAAGCEFICEEKAKRDGRSVVLWSLADRYQVGAQRLIKERITGDLPALYLHVGLDIYPIRAGSFSGTTRAYWR